MSLALITGGSAGIGAAFADRLASRGHDLILVARGELRLNAMARVLAARHGVRVDTFVTDLADRHGLFRLEALLSGPEGLAVDVLVNNAGCGRSAQFPHAERRHLQAEIDLNITATIGLTHAVLPGMLQRGRGTVVNVGSVAGHLPAPGSSYGPTKAWVAAFTDSLAPVLRGTGVAAIAACPGYVRTGWHTSAPPEGLAGRLLWAEPEHVVDTCLADLERGRVLSVPGPVYRPLIETIEMPRRALRLAARLARASRPDRRETAAPAPDPAPAPASAPAPATPPAGSAGGSAGGRRPGLPDLPARPAQRVEPAHCARTSGSDHFVTTRRSSRERRARAVAAARSRAFAAAEQAPAQRPAGTAQRPAGEVAVPSA
ncbi:SDR family oxidoreductase [Pseudonocardia sp. KRD291]|uniref:SDR family NAD(P)-dependent oxidoreductase n=1 Tax=Pseudonocardia sp. KRD291 TaxID=2792007 RepID=UPI001C4A67A5|nr:SDR family NAD(P)-dependent oxidoreductase [Pseudonocardia sp. KRD291]MBW0106636.1 SDR family NAD(P)-dependent oxidoreductase [Pseudonocardia sp. KRD291]